jgi:DNA (cytosine-5)-methyltransferase 3A
MRLLNEVKPKYFLLENVEMGEKWEKVLSKAIGVNGIHINSALVSAQNRKRIFWTNIGMQPMGLFGYLESIIQQPKDKGILLKDILESEVNEKYFLSEKAINKCLKSTANENMLTTDNKDKRGCLIAGYYKTPFDGTYVRDKQFTGLDLNAKSRTIRNGGSATATNKHNWDLIVHNTMPRSSTTGKGGTGPLSRTDGKTYCLDTGNTNAVEIVAMRGRTENKGQDWHNSNHIQKLESRNDGKTNSITGVTKDNLVREVKQISNNNKSNGGTQPYQQDRIYDINGISPALQAQLPKGSTMINTSRIRRLTPIECERLQTVKDNYTAHVSDSQRYRMLGNGWTIDVICHILSYIK